MNQPDPFDPERLRLNGSTGGTTLNGSPRPKAPPRHKAGEKFLKGPIPWRWLEEAARLPGQALALSLYLWREAGCRRRRTVKLCLSRVGLGLSEYAARRALRALEVAGLVEVVRWPGRGLEITILDAASESSAGQVSE